MTLVMKFGGTSVGSAEAMRLTTELILESRAKWGNVVVVASAMGTKPVKVTDLLLNGAHSATSGDTAAYEESATAIQEAHDSAINALLTGASRKAVSEEIGRFMSRYSALCQAVSVLGELSPRALDLIGGMGERMSIRVLAAYLREIGYQAEAIDASELIVTDDNFQDAAVLMEKTTERTQARLQPLLEQGIIPIITGFIGATEDGIFTTLGRGGSDLSASILGGALNAEEVWIWTDVDGVMTTDPRIVDNARSIPQLNHREVAELAFYGAKVLHPKAIRPLVKPNIPMRIKNTFNPDHNGTVILPKVDNSGGAIKAVTAIKDLSLITIEGSGMMGVQGTAARTFNAVAASGANVLLITQASSEQSICFATTNSMEKEVVTALNKAFAKEIERNDIERVNVTTPVSIVTVVGTGMAGVPGVSGKVFSALGNSNINIVAIAQGSSECSISAVVDGADTKTAVQEIHKLIVE